MTSDSHVARPAAIRNRMWMRSAVTIAIVCVIIFMAHAMRSAHAAAAAIEVNGAYALADAKSPSLGYVYLTISVARGADDSLIAARSPLAPTVVLVDPGHHAGTQMRNDPISIPIEGGLPLVLQPRGPHLVLKALSHPLRVGQTLHVVLIFRRAAPIDMPVDVLSRTPAAGAPKLPRGVKID